MTNTDSATSPLQAAAGAVGPHLIESFKLLSNETRLAILLALWEAYEPQGKDNAVPFTELHDRVGIRDSGHFSYHLDELLGHFVEKTPNGYELHNAGLTIVRAVIAGSGFEEGVPADRNSPGVLPLCAPVRLSNEDGRLYQICSECSGNIGPESSEQSPQGTLIVYDDFNPAGLIHRTPEEVFVAGTRSWLRQCSDARSEQPRSGGGLWLVGGWGGLSRALVLRQR